MSDPADEPTSLRATEQALTRLKNVEPPSIWLTMNSGCKGVVRQREYA